MQKFQRLKQTANRYSVFSLKENPFSIAPLFRNFKNKRLCEEDEELFTIPSRVEDDIEILLSMKGRRVLIYGLYGVGKTSLVDFILYLAHNFHNHFCSRVIITQDNVARAINEVLFTLSMDIISEISRRSLTKPIAAIYKWIAEKRYSDLLLSNLARLIGRYSEIEEKNISKKRKSRLQVSPGGMGGHLTFEEEIAIRKCIQTYVDIIPLKKITEYLDDLVEIIQQIGFSDIFIFLDEADHLEHIDQFLRLLTKSREVLFARNYSFFVAGSLELARYLEAMGTIFDKIIFVEPADWITFQDILQQRIFKVNKEAKLADIFDEDALKFIFERSKGIRKQFLRLAQNALDCCAIKRAKKVKKEHCEDVFAKAKDQVTETLKDTHIRILKYLAKHQGCSPSHVDFQNKISLKRVQLRQNLEFLVNHGYVHKEKKGRSSFYYISAQYKPYFSS